MGKNFPQHEANSPAPHFACKCHVPIKLPKGREPIGQGWSPPEGLGTVVPPWQQALCPDSNWLSVEGPLGSF